LPAKEIRTYTMHSPWKEDVQQESVRLTPGEPHLLKLKPFEVLVLDGTPAR
jgi:hypothetical protein